jgi:flagellar basal body-associated protein FliL
MLQVNKSDKELVTYRNFIAVKVPFPLWLQIVILASVLILVAGGIVFLWFFQQSQRKALGISDRRCPDCGRRMKDDWDFCPFCRYLVHDKRRKKKKNKDED